METSVATKLRTVWRNKGSFFISKISVESEIRKAIAKSIMQEERLSAGLSTDEEIIVINIFIDRVKTV